MKLSFYHCSSIQQALHYLTDGPVPHNLWLLLRKIHSDGASRLTQPGILFEKKQYHITNHLCWPNSHSTTFHRLNKRFTILQTVQCHIIFGFWWKKNHSNSASRLTQQAISLEKHNIRSQITCIYETPILPLSVDSTNISIFSRWFSVPLSMNRADQNVQLVFFNVCAFTTTFEHIDITSQLNFLH